MQRNNGNKEEYEKTLKNREIENRENREEKTKRKTRE